ncbi:MAG TPA: aspartate 1-decarboxylase [Nitrospiria bacterium]|nr:aspartate 1-decarboxylase [Nitrospiria bacterium]
MLRLMLKSKIHGATITDANLAYEGSVTIDQEFMDAVGILPYEQVMISNINNGERFETYAIPGERGGGGVCLNGPAARKGVTGDRIVIFCYSYYDEREINTYKPKIIKLGPKNKRID